jgi:hypothetical protein
MAKPAQVARARALRAEGWSYQDVARMVGCAAATAHNWCRDVPVATVATVADVPRGDGAAVVELRVRLPDGRAVELHAQAGADVLRSVDALLASASRVAG